MEQKPVTNEISSEITHQARGQALDTSNPKWTTSILLPEECSNGSSGVETLHCHEDSGGVFTEEDHFAISNDGMSELSDISLPEVCISSNTKLVKEEMNYEVQQAYRIFSEFLTEKHKVITSAFLHPIINEDQETQYGFGGVRSRCPVNVRQSMCLRRMEEKFVHQEYDTITEFVADFRLMLENCYRYRGVDHWLSKQAQKLEIMLEQKLTLLSRKLREKTSLAVTSKGQFGVGEEQASPSSTRRRSTRSIKTLSVGGHESIMVQTLRAEAQQRAREEKRQRELEKKEAEEISAKEIDEWEQNLLSQASPHNVETLWELPAIGHFLCLAQTALNLPEIVFFELERCLLMPRCSILLSKIMSSLLCPPQRRSSAQRCPVLPYRRWESELRQIVKGWYQSVGSSNDQSARADLLGLCHQFFTVLGESSPLEAKAFHMLPFYQRVWLLKGLCDHVYETQKNVQIAVLAQPIHECRESILGYDSKENAYIHFPHFCGADLRIYCQSPCTPPNIPFPSVLVKKIEILHKMEKERPTDKNTCQVYRSNFNEKTAKADMYTNCELGSTDGEDVDRCHSWIRKPREDIQRSDDDECSHESKVEPHTSPIKRPSRKHILIEETSDQEFDLKSKRLKHDSLCPLHRIETIHKRCLSNEEHCYTGRSPAGSVTGFPFENLRIATGSVVPREDQRPYYLNKITHVKLEQCQCCCRCSELEAQLSSEHADTSCEERMNDKILTKKKKWEKKKGREQMPNIKLGLKRSHPVDKRLPCAKTPKPSVPNQRTASKRKVAKRKVKEGK
ncbi:uncharacterized bromodomain-containing protein 10 [Eucyclogobius newberryi]|uniref:uncharacterized bromodomain-containing protein 10 n=1 Tax=Eucyclogobius newberryi TaxID=166745 RepID=UPI003B5902FE